MKDFVGIFKKMDSKYSKEYHRVILEKQKHGNYPLSFSFPLSLQFELTSRCNMTCKHCYNRSGDRDVTDSVSPERWLVLCNEIVQNGGIFQCIISGGEPLLLGDDLIRIMDVLHQDGTSFVLITNGFLLDSAWVEKLKKYRFFWTQVSIDGATPEVHDEFRGVSGSWARAIDASLLLSENGYPLVLAHSVFKGNVNQIEQMIHLSYDLGASAIIIGEILPSGRAIKNDHLFLNDEERNIMYSVIEKTQGLFGGKMEVQRSSSLRSQISRNIGLPNFGGIIRPNGDIRIDCMTPYTIGNISNGSLLSLWDTYGKNCWSHPELKKYLESIDDLTSRSSMICNHVDQDIFLGGCE